VILVDTSGVLAWLDGSQREHGNVARAMSEVEGPFLLSPFVLAELDYLLATRVGRTVQDLLLGEVERGALRLEVFSAADVGAARRVLERYGDLELGLADASVVVLADRHRATRVLTLDARHFRALRRTDGTPFELLPESARDARASGRRRRR
jgi:uncharacterized protein